MVEPWGSMKLNSGGQVLVSGASHAFSLGAWGTSEVSNTLQGDVGVSRRVSGSQQRVKRVQGGMMEVLAVCIGRSEI